tara:strand:+ start:146 stop:805 length:660 start_codon:yes stop_codon:yes gene_type:complete
MKSKLNQIKELLNIQVKLEEMKLENGTVISAESFEKDNEIFIVTDDEKVAMPVGEYLLEDGRLIVVSEEGIIADVRDVADDAPQKETEEGEEITEDLEGDHPEEKKYAEEADVADWQGMEKRIQNLEDAIADLKGDKESKMTDVEEEQELEVEPQNVLKSRTVKEEFSEVEKADLSQASAKPIKHNPETVGKTKKKVEFVKNNKFGASALDRVLSRLNK